MKNVGCLKVHLDRSSVGLTCWIGCISITSWWYDLKKKTNKQTKKKKKTLRLVFKRSAQLPKMKKKKSRLCTCPCQNRVEVIGLSLSNTFKTTILVSMLN